MVFFGGVVHSCRLHLLIQQGAAEECGRVEECSKSESLCASILIFFDTFEMYRGSE
jgi:hypothetical protein